MEHESWNSGASSSLSVTTPSFSTRSSEDIADIAARVLHELNLSNHDDDFYDDYYSSLPQNDAVKPHADETNKTTTNNDDDNDNVESEFEFAVLCNGDTSSPISADEIFSNGQIKTTYPIFGYKYDVVSTKTTSLRLPLRKLMKQDNNESGNDDSSSSSSSSDDELEGVPKETYCAWAPPGTMKKKSNSTGAVGSSSGSSRRWRFKDLLHRSHSDGKDSFDFTTTSKKEKVTGDVIVNGKNKKGGVKKKKKSYLPYRQDIVGLFGNVNGLSRTIRPF